jgi:hypothetical protein
MTNTRRSDMKLTKEEQAHIYRLAQARRLLRAFGNEGPDGRWILRDAAHPGRLPVGADGKIKPTAADVRAATREYLQGRAPNLQQGDAR